MPGSSGFYCRRLKIWLIKMKGENTTMLCYPPFQRHHCTGSVITMQWCRQSIQIRQGIWDMIWFLYCLFFLTAHFKFVVSSVHVQGAKNTVADAISRNRFPVLQTLAPQIHQALVDIPVHLKELVLDKQSDWTFQHWRGQFQTILKWTCQLHISLILIRREVPEVLYLSIG